MIYTTVLLLHSWVRWVVILTGLLALGRAYAGWLGGKPWTRGDDATSSMFARTLDVQFLLGVLLYVFLSPITHAAFSDIGGAMSNRALRFWAIEHVVGMFIGVALAHIGVARLRKRGADARRHKIAAIFFTLSMLVILASIPWPGTPNGRPLIRW